MNDEHLIKSRYFKKINPDAHKLFYTYHSINPGCRLFHYWEWRFCGPCGIINPNDRHP